MRRNDEKPATNTAPARDVGPAGPSGSLRPESRAAAPESPGTASDTTPGQRIPTLSFSPVAAPSPSLPKGGGALRGIGEKFQVSAATGTGSLALPIPLSPGRPGGLAPSLALAYDSGAGNGVFGLGWHLGIPSVQRKTEKRIPTYNDVHDSDVFVMAGAEDLVPAWITPPLGGALVADEFDDNAEHVRRYRPRIEGGFARIERRTRADGTAYFRTVTPTNVTHVFGDTPETRIADPADPRRVFSWLLSRSYDDRGNVVVYEYAAEDLTGVSTSEIHESSRHAGNTLFSNKHLKRVRYGNATAYDPSSGVLPSFFFDVVLDYGDHDADTPLVAPAPGAHWTSRQDPFSTGRAGFEMRTYRLCRRVLVFHTFSELGQTPVLVRSLDLTYDPNPYATRLVSASVRGYSGTQEEGYSWDAGPPVSFEYSIPTLDFTVRTLETDALADVSTEALSGRAQWIDLDGEGLTGLLLQKEDALYYKRNRGDGRFTAAQRMDTQPSLTSLGEGLLHVSDLAASGERAMVALARPISGYFLRTQDPTPSAQGGSGGPDWAPFRPFLAQPNIDFADPNLRFLDLNGDGMEDILLARDDSFVWYPSRGKEGFDPPRTFPRPRDGEHGPALVFADGTGTVFLADMTGDGLADFVRVTRARVSYWPNLGHGRFGAEIVMSHCPFLDDDEGFSPARVHLADLDGTGPADLVYANSKGLRIFFNQAGNRWSDGHEIRSFPAASAGGTFAIVDLLGSGTACLVWRNTTSTSMDEPLRYIDLLGGKKPHLLVRSDNHMGLETRVAYAPSTKFYLQDLKAGTPWVTRLPFPVLVVERVEVYEAITRTRLVTTYSYHHGCYDGEEREFRGFGRVDQRDTESVADGFGQGLFTDKPAPQNGECPRPPVLTKTWFHTGAFLGKTRIEERYRAEYFSPSRSGPDPRLLADTVLPEGLSLAEKKHACRALKGATLRSEVYALDGTSKEPVPYTVSEQSYAIRRVQPPEPGQGDTLFGAVFMVHGREVVQTVYERNSEDPRVSQQLTLEVDDLGHVTRGITLAYGRTSGEAFPEQQKTWVALAENDLLHLTSSLAGYRHGLPLESRIFEITGLPELGDEVLYTTEGLAAALASIGQPGSTVEKRLLGRVNHRYYDSASLTGTPAPLPMGQVDLLALPYESYSLALDAVNLAEYNGRVTTAMLTEGGYVEHESGTWWAPSGRTTVDPAHFYLPVATVDPFGNTTSVAYDAHHLFATTVTDAIGNTVTADIDYHLLAAWRITDPNGNRSAARFDRLGRVVATAVMGKAGSTDGDTLDEPTARFTYVTDAFSTAGKPNYAKAEVRETHGDAQTRWQVSYAYSDGMGRVAMTKAQAEPGMAPQRDAQGQLVRDNDGALVYAAAATRWVGTGRAVFDNKGQPVKQYEPYFSSVPDFEDEDELVATGVTPILRYDPLGRLTRTDLPNGSYTRSTFDAWTQMAWDPNDTCGEAGNAWTAARLPGATPTPSAEEQRAAELALEHADTPATSHIDALGRVFLVQARLTAIGATPQKIVETRTEMDIEGQVLAVRDALGSDAGNGVLGRVCAESRHAIGGQAIWSSHIDSGLGYVLSDVAGAPLYAWDALGHRVRTQVDALRRVTHVWVKKGSDAEWLSQRMVYGEAVDDPEIFNLRGKVLYHFDGAGLVASGTYDFKGNLLSSWRRLAVIYDAEPTWTALATTTDPADVLAEAESEELLESETFSKSTTYDALNRPISMTQPDASVLLPSFNEAGLLDGVDVKIRGAATVTTFVSNIDYDVKGRREKIEYGNGTTTTYDYDPLTYRLTRLKTTRASDSAVLQNLFYTYDPVGNILAIADSAHDSVFFAGQQVTPSALYEYDALYRLVRATGREHAGGVGDDQRDANDLPLWNLPHPNDAQALRNYVEQYEYDLVGNIEKMVHTAVNSAVGSWTRRYAYGNDPFPGTPPQTPLVAENNRLHSTSLPGDSATGPFTATYTHDANGNMVAMPHLAAIEYTYTSQMREADLGGGGTAYYTYDASGERVRKVIQRLGTTREERICLGGWELYRKRQGAEAEIVLERETLHVMDDARRIAMVETKTVDADVQGTLTVVSRIRYQLDNHLGTATLELDETGLVISYEEYHPYGTSAYRSARSGVEVSEKRYRYTGKERDEETGFGYHSARYLVPWLGRWTSADPKGMVDGPSLYAYCRGAPVSVSDPSGTYGNPELEPTMTSDDPSENVSGAWIGGTSNPKDELPSIRRGIRAQYAQTILKRAQQGRAPEVDYFSAAEIQRDIAALMDFHNVVWPEHEEARRYFVEQKYRQDEWNASGAGGAPPESWKPPEQPIIPGAGDRLGTFGRDVMFLAATTPRGIAMLTAAVADAAALGRALGFRAEGELIARGFFSRPYQAGAAGGFRWGVATTSSDTSIFRLPQLVTGGRLVTLAAGEETIEGGLTLVRALERGETWSAIQDEMRYLQWSTQQEHYLISFKDNSVKLFSGGQYSTTFEFTSDMRRVLMHTHPLVTGRSAADAATLSILGQRSSWLLEPGMPLQRIHP